MQLIGIALPLAFVVIELASGELDPDWGALAVLAPLCGGILGAAYLAYYTGLQRGPVSIVTTAASAWFAVTIVFAVVVFSERVTAGQGALMALILAGIVMLSLQRSSAPGGSSGLWWGLLAMLGLGVAMGLFERVTEAAGAMLAVASTRTLAMLPAYAMIRARRERVRFPSDGRGWRLLFAAGVLDAGGYVAYNLGIEVAPVTVVAPLVAAHPVATVALAVAVLRERPRATQWAGGAVVVGAVVALSAVVGG